MRIDRINLTVDTDDVGRVRSAGIYFENTNDLGDRISGTFGITSEQYREVQDGTITIKDIAKDRISSLFELTEDDDAMVGIINLREELDVTKAEINKNTKDEIEAAKEEFEKSVETAKATIEEVAKNIILEETEKVKDIVRSIVKINDLSAEEINKLINLYPEWKVGDSVNTGDIRRYKNELYEAVQSHTIQENYQPDIVAALWKKVSPPKTENGEEIIAEFKQPTGAHDAYRVGDKVIFKDNIYESLIDNNAHSPEAYAAGWRIVE